MRVLSKGKEKASRIPVNYKLQPLIKSVVTLATDALGSISAEINVNYSEFIEDSVFHLLEADTILYQVDKEQFTLKQLLALQLGNLEETIQSYVEAQMDEWKESLRTDYRENNEGEWEAEFDEEDQADEEDREVRLDGFIDEKMQVYNEEGDFETELFEKIYEEIESAYGEVFGIAKIVNPEWSKKMDQYIRIVFEKSEHQHNQELMMVAGVLYKNKLIYMQDEKLMAEYFTDKELQEKIMKEYINIRTLIETIKQNYGSDIFNEAEIYDIREMILHEALNDKKLAYIVKRMNFKKKD